MRKKPIRLISGDTGSADVVSKVSRFLKACALNHGSCMEAMHTESGATPARLIEIALDIPSSTGCLNIRLAEDLPEKTRYVCLSHCWGTENFLCTDTSLLEEFTRTIPWSLRPETFQDAIYFTHRLGLRYI
jgi:hypothetical protein